MESLNKICIICYDAPIDTNINLYSCHHQSFCKGCFPRFWNESQQTQCPECLTPVMDVIYFSGGNMLTLNNKILDDYCLVCSKLISMEETFNFCPCLDDKRHGSGDTYGNKICSECIDFYGIKKCVAACESNENDKSRSETQYQPIQEKTDLLNVENDSEDELYEKNENI